MKVIKNKSFVWFHQRDCDVLRENGITCFFDCWNYEIELWIHSFDMVLVSEYWFHEFYAVNQNDVLNGHNV